jgi:hypothetical protein
VSLARFLGACLVDECNPLAEVERAGGLVHAPLNPEDRSAPSLVVVVPLRINRNNWSTEGTAWDGMVTRMSTVDVERVRFGSHTHAHTQTSPTTITLHNHTQTTTTTPAYP